MIDAQRREAMRGTAPELSPYRSGRSLRRVGVAIACAAAMLVAPNSSMARNDNRDTYTVNHQGVYLVQQLGRCMNGTGPCYFGGQCPGGEYTTNRYTNGRVYCQNFYPPTPDYNSPSLFERLFGKR
jgi:hypothetical protein